MNKTFIPLIVIVALLLVAGAGFAIWNMANAPKTDPQNQEEASTTNPNQTTAPEAGAPTVKTDSATAPYISTVVVKGSVNPNGASTTYWYEYGQTSALGLKTATYLAGSGHSTIYTPAYITGLLSNTDYHFRLVAKNILGTVNGETYSFKTNTTPAPTGSAPSINTNAAANITRNTASLQGQINPKGSETTFWFEYGTTADLGWVSALQSAGSDTTSMPISVAISNLQPLTKYYFRLNAQNQFGTVNGQILHFTTQGPFQPSSPAAKTEPATAVTDDSAKFNANINPNGAATTWWFEYSDNSLLSNVLIKTTPQESLESGTASVNVSANVDNLANDTQYYVRVVAKNQYGTVTGGTQSFTTKK